MPTSPDLPQLLDLQQKTRREQQLTPAVERLFGTGLAVPRPQVHPSTTREEFLPRLRRQLATTLSAEDVAQLCAPASHHESDMRRERWLYKRSLEEDGSRSTMNALSHEAERHYASLWGAKLTTMDAFVP